MQIEYALAAVAAGAASVGIKGTNFEIFHISLYRGSIECYKNIAYELRILELGNMKHPTVGSMGSICIIFVS